MRSEPGTGGDRPTVTVIIPVYNDVERLRTCLAALVAQDYPAEKIDVVVADNASTQDVSAALPPGDDRFQVVHEARRGSYAARNAGLRVATGEVYAFTDSDCLPRPDWLSQAVTALTAPGGPDAVGGEIHLVFRNGGGPSTGPEFYEAVDGFNQRRFVEGGNFAATANLVVPADVMRAVGPFNPDFQSGGDDEWGHRLTGSGHRLAYSADAVVDHPSRPTWRELRRKTVRVAHGVARLTASQPTGTVLRELVREARGGVTVWLSIWFKDWPERPVEKARFAASLTYVAALRCGIRGRYLLPARWRPGSAPA